MQKIESTSELLIRYIKLLKGRINHIPSELYDVLGFKSSQFTVDFVKLMYIRQSFASYDEIQNENLKLDLYDLLTRHRLITIVGNAGNGKTTTLKYIINEMCNDILGVVKGEANDLAYLVSGLEGMFKEVRNIRENLLLIEERISEYPLSTDVPLSLIKEREGHLKRLNKLNYLISQIESIENKAKCLLPIPIFVGLGELSKYLTENRKRIEFEDILEHLAVKDYKTIESLSGILFKQVEEGNACVVFDGLDELVEESRLQILEIIGRLARSYTSQLIITTREHAYSLLSGFESFRINAFNSDQIDDYIVRWYSDIYKVKGSIYECRLFAWSLYNKIKNGGLLQLAQKPLILTQIVILHKDEKDLSLNNLSVMQKILRLLLFRWRSGLYESYYSFLALREKIKLSDDELLRITGCIAFHLLKTNTLYPSVETLRPHVLKWIQDFLENIEIGQERAPDIILDYLQNCDGLLNASHTKPQKYTFDNMKIQEYLAAYYLIGNPPYGGGYSEQLPELIDVRLDYWSGVTGFVCELLPQNAALMFVDFLTKILVIDVENHNKIDGKILCGQIVNRFMHKGYDFRRHSLMLNELKQGIHHIVEDPNTEWPQSALAGNILGNLGDSRSYFDYIFSPDYWEKIEKNNFAMGYDGERHLVELETFYIGKYLVTNEQFYRFVLETSYDRVPENWKVEKPYLHKRNYPVIGLHWAEALDFAKWLNTHPLINKLPIDGLDIAIRLPTEAEWERAAQDFKNRDEFLQSLEKYKQSPDCFPYLLDCNVWPIGLACVHDEKAARIYDLFNNVWEWTLSSYEPYPYNDDDGRNSSKQNQPKVIRGGYSPFGDEEFLRTHRNQCHMYRPVYKINNVGFRLVLGRRIE